MSTPNYWTPSQKQAWDYVVNANSRGLKQTEALTAYRAGGGSIRTSDFSEIWHRYGDASEAWSTIYQYKTTDTIPESTYLDTTVNYSDKYTVVFKANVRDEQGTIIHDVFRQASFSNRPTLGEINSAMNNMMLDDPSIPVQEVYQVTSIEFYNNTNR